MKKKEDDINFIENEIDKILDKFNNEEFDIQKFISYSKLLNQTFLNNLGLHRKSRQCAFPDCSNKSIKKSHSIPKSSSLCNITTDGHLLKPEFDFSNNIPIIEMQLIGINNASVFPGYCKEHENIFKTFEIYGKMDDSKKALLQTYRSICRERVYREIEIEINEKSKSKYKRELNNEALKIIADNLLKYIQFEKKIKSVEISGVDTAHHFLEILNKSLIDINKDLLEFENKIYHYLYSKSKKNEIFVKVLNIDIKFPISLCGFANLTFKEKEIEKTEYAFLNVLPLEDSTEIICVGLEREKSMLERYCDYSFSDPLTVLNMIESFMINGSDHWFINPDFWQRIPKQKQQKILFDLLYTKDSFLDEYPISIFDDIRKNILAVLKDNTKNRKLTRIEKERIDLEIQKLTTTEYNIIKDKEKLIELLINRMNLLNKHQTQHKI